MLDLFFLLKKNVEWNVTLGSISLTNNSWEVRNIMKNKRYDAMKRLTIVDEVKEAENIAFTAPFSLASVIT